MSRHAKFLRSDAKRWSKSLNDLSSKNTNLWQHHQAGDNFVWETHKVSLTRVPRFGFGIAVSGGKDNPHFANGDPSIAISDVLKAGPAEGKLLINDRVISVNGILLDNVEHSQAITVLKESGNTVHLEIKRRVVLPTANDMENTPLKLTLMKRNRKDDFGVVLGVQFYIKEIIGNSLASQDGSMKEGDYVLKINNTAVENLSLAEARKLIEKSKDKLQLCISKKRQDELRNLVNKAQDDEYSLGYGTLQGTLQSKTGTINDVNVYRSPSQNDDDVYKGYSQQNIPKGAYPRSPEHSRYDGRYVYDHEAPPRPPLPTEADAPPRPPSPGKDLLRPDDFYNSSAPRSPSAVQDGYLSDGGRYYPSQVDGGMRRRHDERYVGKRKDITLEPRYVYFEKEPEMGLGLRLAGGNSTGIFIASVQPGSGADLVGLTEGDKILKANDRDIPGMTREEAVGYLTSLQGRVSMAVQYMKEEYDRIMSSHEAGDSFYIRTHFAYEQKEAGELSFTTGDLFHVKDTLYRGVVGSWLVLRLGRNNQETQKGIIPNMNRAEQLAQAKNQDSEEKENSPSKRSILFRKNKAARRSKSLGKDHWEDVIFSDSGASVSTKFPAYERVVLKDLSFHRPVVIFGALADIAREKLLKEYPDLFESPQSDGSNTEDNKNKTGIIRLGAIKDIIAKRKHCLLDVTPYNVDKLNFAQYYPVVIFLRAENKAVVKDIRARLAKGSSKNPKKLFEQSQKLEKMYMHLMTSTISHNATDIWYHRLLEVVNTQQKQPVWVSEKKPEEDISDDYLFPMSNRLSFSPSRESEIDLSRPADDMVDTSTMQRRPLVRSSSDPSINTADRVPGIPPYPAPPSYHKAPLSARSPGMQDDRRYLDLDPPSEDRYYPSYYAADHQPTPRAGIDPYATLTPHERLAYARQQQQDERWYNPAYDGQAPQGNVYGRDHRRSESDLGYGQQRPSQSSYNDPPPPQPHHPHENRMYNDNSSYSGDSYSKYASNPANRHDDSKLRDKLKHDPYRFTRSTNNPVNTSHVDRSKLSELSAKYRKEEPSRSRSVPSLRPASSPPDSSVPFRDANGKKVPPPVPVKTYKDRGIEPDEMKIRNYEQTRSPYSDANSTYAVVNKIKTSSHHTNLYGDENPYDYVAPRNAYQRGTPNSQGHYSRPSQDHSIPENSSYERSRGPGNARSFVNQIYMDHQELQKLKAERDQQRAVMSPHGNQEGYTRDSGFTSPADRPRTDDELAAFKHTSDIDEHAEVLSPKTPPFNSFSAYKRLITPGFYTSPSHLNKQRERERERLGNPSDSDMDERGSAFEAYRKPTSLSTFGKSPEQPNGPLSPKSMQPNRHYSQPLSEQSESEAKSEKSGDGSIEVSDKSHDISQDASVGSGAISDQLSTSEILITSNGVDSSKDVGESHTVVATARGIFDHKGGVLESKETGVSIVIPEGAIPEGVQQEIYFKVCKDNNILPPLDRDKGETLLSPLVMCGPHGLKFLHPVELRLPHCASVNPDSWSFALKSSDSPSGLPTQWQNMNLAGGDGLTQGHVGKNSVSVLVDHF